MLPRLCRPAGRRWAGEARGKVVANFEELLVVTPFGRGRRWPPACPPQAEFPSPTWEYLVTPRTGDKRAAGSRHRDRRDTVHEPQNTKIPTTQNYGGRRRGQQRFAGRTAVRWYTPHAHQHGGTKRCVRKGVWERAAAFFKTVVPPLVRVVRRVGFHVPSWHLSRVLYFIH